MIGSSTNSGEGGRARQGLPEFLRPNNSYNIFFTLERVRLIEARRREGEVGGGAIDGGPLSTSSGALSGYERLELPPLPPRYEHLGPALPDDWYVPMKHRNVNRKHPKMHGSASFKEIASIIAEKWKAIDPVTKAYVEAVADIQKEKHHELERMGNSNPGKGSGDQLSTKETASRCKMPEMPGGVTAPTAPPPAHLGFPSQPSHPPSMPDQPWPRGHDLESATGYHFHSSNNDRAGSRRGSPSLDRNFSGVPLDGPSDIYVPRQQDFFYGRNNNNNNNNNNDVAHRAHFDEEDVKDEDIMEAYHCAD